MEEVHKRHRHRISGTLRDTNGHVHAFSDYTSFDNPYTGYHSHRLYFNSDITWGHWHVLEFTSGVAFSSLGHSHELAFYSAEPGLGSSDDFHYHDFVGETSPAEYVD